MGRRIVRLIVVVALASIANVPDVRGADDVRARLDEATALLNNQGAAQAMAILQPLLTDPAVTSDESLMADVLFLTGTVYFQRNDYATAMQYYERARALSRAHGKPLTEARTLFYIAQTYKNQGSYESALASAEQARAVYQSIDDRQGQARSWTVLGAVRDLMGRHREALESYQTAFTMFDGVENQASIRLLNEIGITEKNLGNYQAAFDYYQRGVDAQARIGDRYGQAVTLSNIGVLYNIMGEVDLAVEYYQRSLAIAREIKERRGETMLLGDLGEASFERGDWTRALEFLNQELAITRELGNRNEQALALKNIGDIYSARGDLDAASGTYDAALQIQRQIGAERRQGSTLLAVADLRLKQAAWPEAERLGREALALAVKTETPDLEWKTRLTIARAERADGRPIEALDELRASARLVNDLRANVWSDAAKIGFVDLRQEVFEELASVLLSLGRPDEALEAAEAARARAFADLLEQRHVQAKPADADAFTAVRTALDEVRSAPIRTPSTPPPGDARRAASGSGDALERSLARLRAEHRELASLFTADSPTRDEIAATAARLHATFVEYLVTDRAVLAWVVGPEGRPRATTIAIDRKRLEGLVGAVKTAVDEADRGVPASPLRQRLRELHRLLIAPLRPWLPASADGLVVIVPNGPLAVVPFAALENEDGTPLVAQHTLAFAPSIAVYRYTADKRRPRAADPVSALVVADPQPPSSSGLEALEGAREEGRLVARRLGAAHVELLTGARASEAAVKRDAAGRRILHFATHGLISAERPLASSLLLAAGDGEDGYLRADEIFQLPLSADLVVLSGCSTGLGRLSGDGIVGLSRAFIYAGTPTVVVSQWDVNDQATSYLMDTFYARLHEGLGPAASLRAAQLAARKRFVTPAMWAAFVVVGEPR